MKNLPLPTFNDDALVKAICHTKSWAVHEKAWKKTYKAYVAAKGDAGALKKWTTTPPIGDDIYKLYDSKSQTNDFKDMRSAFVGCCPMCGSDSTMDLDHFIPRFAFPEFAIFSKNLVPTCPYCNRGVKKQTVMGTEPQDRFLHPYFDTMLDQPIWRATFKRPYEAVVFGWEPMPSIMGPDHKRVSFHLDHVLGEGFQKAAHGYWLGHLGHLRGETNLGTSKTISPHEVLLQTLQALKFAQPNDLYNSWRAAFFRGLSNDPAAMAWLAAEASKPKNP